MKIEVSDATLTRLREWQYWRETDEDTLLRVLLAAEERMTCGECGEVRPFDPRVQGGMKCVVCAYVAALAKFTT